MTYKQNSVDFVNSRLSSGYLKGFEEYDFGDGFAVVKYNDFLKVYHSNYFFRNTLIEAMCDNIDIQMKGCVSCGGDIRSVTIHEDFRHADVYKFDYVAHHISTHDGTLLFLYTAMKSILLELISLKSVNKNLIPVMECGGEFKLVTTIGDFVVWTDVSNKYSTDEKPWLQERQIVFLPVSMKLVKL